MPFRMGAMALTRAAFLTWHASHRRLLTRGMSVATLFLSCSLSACAAGVDEYEGEDLTSIDSAVTPPVQEPPVVDAGLVLPPYDSGSIVPMVPMTPTTPKDAGTTGSVRDAGGSSTTRDSGSGTLEPVVTPMDSGTTTPVTPPPVDSGSTTPPVDSGGGSTGANMCSAAPSYSTASSCGKCTCMKCATQVTSCFASNDSAKNTTCATVHACAEKNHCAGQACYCGS